MRLAEESGLDELGGVREDISCGKNTSPARAGWWEERQTDHHIKTSKSALTSRKCHAENHADLSRTFLFLADVKKWHTVVLHMLLGTNEVAKQEE